MNDLYFQARRTFPPLPSCTALGIYIDEELIRILIYCLFPHILVHLGPCLGKHFSTVGIFGLFPTQQGLGVDELFGVHPNVHRSLLVPCIVHCPETQTDWCWMITPN